MFASKGPRQRKSDRESGGASEREREREREKEIEVERERATFRADHGCL